MTADNRPPERDPDDSLESGHLSLSSFFLMVAGMLVFFALFVLSSEPGWSACERPLQAIFLLALALIPLGAAAAARSRDEKLPPPPDPPGPPDLAGRSPTPAPEQTPRTGLTPGTRRTAASPGESPGSAESPLRFFLGLALAAAGLLIVSMMFTH